MPLLKPKGTSVVFSNAPPLSQREVNDELKALSQRSWSALMQMLEEFRQEHAAAAASQARNNNPLAMAGDACTYEALSGLIELLNERRVTSSD